MDPAVVVALLPMVIKAVSFMVETLVNVVRQNKELIKGAEGDFHSLLDEAQGLNASLAADYAELNKNNNPTKWDELSLKILRTAYKAEDSIDKFLVQAKIDQDNTLKKLFPIDKVVDRWTKLPEINKILTELREIRQEIQQAVQESPQTGLQPENSSTAQQTQGSALEDHEVIGFDESAEKVRKRLVEGSEDLEVASIVGMPGLGKTTLARKVYHDPVISFEFFKRIWVYVGPSYVEKDIFLNIHKGLELSSEGVQDKNGEQLAKEIHDFVIKGGRYLIVLDDVWKAKAVNFVKTAFPDKKGRHRILMTTREKQVATPVSAYLHDLKFLEDPESFELLEKRVFGKRKKFPIQLVGHGEKILESCSGVPLAIVVIAGVLSSCSEEIEWQLVEENVGQYLVKKEDPKSCLKIVEMSYNHLPQDKRASFLYIGAFPRGFVIPAWKLIRLWIAEGLIKSSLRGSEIEVIAEYYLNDIANRNLVIVMQKRSNGQVKTFRVHDMVHEFCNGEAKRVCLFQQLYPTTPNLTTPSIRDPVTSRRLCIKSSIPHNFIPEHRDAEHVRSFLCFSPKGIDVSNVEIQLLPKAFPLIRVCDIQSFIFKFVPEFYILFHMRYLAVSGEFQSLSPLFGNFWNLQTLMLHTNQSTLEIKEGIWKMLQLRHLHTNKPVKLPLPSNPISKSSCLQTLSKIAPESCTRNVLAKVCNLKKLGIEGKLEALLGFESFEELKCLERLKMLNDIMSPKIQLPQLFFTYLRTLKKLTLSSTKIDWSEAKELGKLESLEILKLKDNACVGKSWKPEAGSFRLLQVLLIHLTDLKTWDTSNCRFGRLRHLVLISCYNLEAVPHELANSPYLTEIRLQNTQNAVNSAKEIKRKKLEMQAPGNIEFNLVIFPPQADAN
ncbi:putative late blight resistance protein homolog R1B-14 [Nicotiana tabacum]|uniref:Late blight resistance protein homolog R1B-14 n=1 Tax=Nicotiana tabacum TaxID=4097 RepID=A0AC58SYW3_TOBAC